MNIVIASRIIELTDKRHRFYSIRKLISSWKSVCFIVVLALTIKVAAEQLAMVLR